jgi:hypothetical protein
MSSRLMETASGFGVSEGLGTGASFDPPHRSANSVTATTAPRPKTAKTMCFFPMAVGMGEHARGGPGFGTQHQEPSLSHPHEKQEFQVQAFFYLSCSGFSDHENPKTPSIIRSVVCRWFRVGSNKGGDTASKRKFELNEPRKSFDERSFGG